MMSHRKKEHKMIIKNRNEFLRNNCRFQNELCWYKHEVVNKESDMESNAGKESNDKNKNGDNGDSVFQQASKKKEPPLVDLEKEQNITK